MANNEYSLMNICDDCKAKLSQFRQGNEVTFIKSHGNGQTTQYNLQQLPWSERRRQELEHILREDIPKSAAIRPDSAISQTCFMCGKLTVIPRQPQSLVDELLKAIEESPVSSSNNSGDSTSLQSNAFGLYTPTYKSGKSTLKSFANCLGCFGKSLWCVSYTSLCAGAIIGMKCAGCSSNWNKGRPPTKSDLCNAAIRGQSLYLFVVGAVVLVILVL